MSITRAFCNWSLCWEKVSLFGNSSFYFWFILLMSIMKILPTFILKVSIPATAPPHAKIWRRRSKRQREQLMPVESSVGCCSSLVTHPWSEPWAQSLLSSDHVLPHPEVRGLDCSQGSPPAPNNYQDVFVNSARKSTSLTLVLYTGVSHKYPAVLWQWQICKCVPWSQRWVSIVCSLSGGLCWIWLLTISEQSSTWCLWGERTN